MESSSPGVSPAAWLLASRELFAKMLGEFCYEELLRPVPASDGCYLIALPSGVEYCFRARRGSFGAWRVNPASITRRCEGADGAADDPLQFVLDARRVLGLDAITVAEVLREMMATLRADAWLRAESPTAAELADLSYVDLEGYQTGHPCMVLNKGRLGFSVSDITKYAPESRQDVRLVWIAVHHTLGNYHGPPAPELLEEELDEVTRAEFASALAQAEGTDPAEYDWMPVHPWHWDEAVVPLFAPYLADRMIVRLGIAPDRYRPLQSIRTLVNLDAPHRRNVKLPLLIRNTLVWRGLGREAIEAAPEVTEWLLGIRERDPFLSTESRMVPLGEVASVAVHHPLFEQLSDAPYRYHELLGVVWRDPVEVELDPGERARTMAALLQVDPAGRALVTELVERSRLDARTWLHRLLGALLPGLLHYLYRYGVAFCPHGENTVVIFDRDHVPVRIAVKDFAEDVNLLPDALPEYADLPPLADAVLLRWPAEELRHSLLSAVFAGHFRFFSDLVATHLGVPEPEFWQLVRDAILGYQARFPELAGRFAAFELLGPSFPRVALNREQLLSGGFHDRPDCDATFDITHGTIPNPLHIGHLPSEPE